VGAALACTGDGLRVRPPDAGGAGTSGGGSGGAGTGGIGGGVVAGTSGSIAGTSGGVAGTLGAGGAAGTFSPACHYDCFGGTTCLGGVVTSYRSAPVSCQYWTGSCPVSATYRCAQGCAIEFGNIGNVVPSGGLAAFCKETQNAKVGDACSQYGGVCVPTRASDGPDGGIETDYLACDPAASRCVASAGPPAADFGAPCQVPNATGTGYRYVSSACPKQYCLRFDDPASSCARWGCTGSCWGDHQCPAGWFCDGTLKDLSTGVVGSPAVCRPGPRDGVPRSLACSSP
jgi:hypothetical protein